MTITLSLRARRAPTRAAISCGHYTGLRALVKRYDRVIEPATLPDKSNRGILNRDPIEAFSPTSAAGRPSREGLTRSSQGPWMPRYSVRVSPASCPMLPHDPAARATESDSFAFIASLLVVQADQRGLEHHLICRDELEAEPFDQCLRKNLRGELERRCAAERRTLVRVDVRHATARSRLVRFLKEVPWAVSSAVPRDSFRMLPSGPTSSVAIVDLAALAAAQPAFEQLEIEELAPRSVSTTRKSVLKQSRPMRPSMRSRAWATCSCVFSSRSSMSWKWKRRKSRVSMALSLPLADTTQSISTADICSSRERSRKSRYVRPFISCRGGCGWPFLRLGFL